jgi:hypothetical protein
MLKTEVRFKPGDRVRMRVLRQDAKASGWITGVVREVDAGHMVPQYVVDFGGKEPERVRQFDLYPDSRVEPTST